MSSLLFIQHSIWIQIQFYSTLWCMSACLTKLLSQSCLNFPVNCNHSHHTECPQETWMLSRENSSFLHRNTMKKCIHFPELTQVMPCCQNFSLLLICWHPVPLKAALRVPEWFWAKINFWSAATLWTIQTSEAVRYRSAVILYSQN